MHILFTEIFGLVVLAAICYGAVVLIKYLIRYGIDYYFTAKARSEQKMPGSGDERKTGE